MEVWTDQAGIGRIQSIPAHGSVLKAAASINVSKALPKSRGFTLVELLTVIAVTGILLALLFPALAGAGRKSKSVACQGNLRQLGMVLRIYLEDFAGTYPYVVSFPTTDSRRTSYWFDALALNMPNAQWGYGVFQCPAYRGLVYEGQADANARGDIKAVSCPCGSYAYNAAGRRQLVSGASSSISPGLGFAVFAGRPMEQPVREDEVKAPADLYALGDAPLCTAPWGAAPRLSLGGAADYNSLIAENAVIEKASHTLVFNMLFADAHAESVKTEVLTETSAAHRSRWNHDHLP